MNRTFRPTNLDLIILKNRKKFLENEDMSKVLKQKEVDGIRHLIKNDYMNTSDFKIQLVRSEKRLKNHEQESAKLSRDWFTTMAYIKRHGHDLIIDGPICHCDEEIKTRESSESDQEDEWENIYQEYDQNVGDREFHFYETYGGGPSGGYAVPVGDSDNIWEWSQNWGTVKSMRLLNSKIEIREHPDNNFYQQIRTV